MENDITQQIINFLITGSLSQYITAGMTILGGLVTIASVIAPFTTTVKDDEAVSWVKALIHRFTVIAPQPPVK